MHIFVANLNHAVGLNFQGNSGGSGFYGVKGKKVIVVIVSEFLDESCDWFILRSATPWQTTLTFRSLSSVLNVVFSSSLFRLSVHKPWKKILS